MSATDHPTRAFFKHLQLGDTMMQGRPSVGVDIASPQPNQAAYATTAPVTERAGNAFYRCQFSVDFIAHTPDHNDDEVQFSTRLVDFMRALGTLAALGPANDYRRGGPIALVKDVVADRITLTTGVPQGDNANFEFNATAGYGASLANGSLLYLREGALSDLARVNDDPIIDGPTGTAQVDRTLHAYTSSAEVWRVFFGWRYCLLDGSVRTAETATQHEKGLRLSFSGNQPFEGAEPLP